MDYQIIKQWCREHKGTLEKVAMSYSGDFMLKLVRAFGHADRINESKILDNWEREFTELYGFFVALKDNGSSMVAGAKKTGESYE